MKVQQSNFSEGKGALSSFHSLVFSEGGLLRRWCFHGLPHLVGSQFHKREEKASLERQVLPQLPSWPPSQDYLPREERAEQRGTGGMLFQEYCNSFQRGNSLSSAPNSARTKRVFMEWGIHDQGGF